ncbi:hypothetical protein GOV03_05040 [Candidatus Woesearchaeota archaeon]|nr:hypothetical protein [Candidatus Woesearchaeota archaeon]
MNIKQTLVSIALTGAMALGMGGCPKLGPEYSLQMGEYTCQAEFHGSHDPARYDPVWLSKGEQVFGIKIVSHCTGENGIGGVSYAVDLSGNSTPENFSFELISRDGKLLTDSSWYSDPERRKEYLAMQSLIKKCEQLLEQKYNKDF